MKFNRLVAYGCSYTSGAETIDEECYPGAEQIKIKHGPHHFYDLLFKDKNLNFVDHDNLSKKNSWANQLADRLGIPCLNNSVSGNSFQKMYWELERDLVNGTILDTDIVFIGITSPERVAYFTDDGPITLHLAHPDRWPKNIRQSAGAVTDFFSDEQIKLQFLVLLEAFTRKAETELKDRLYFVECDPRALYTEYTHVDPTMKAHPEWFHSVVTPAYNKFKNSKYLLSKYGMYYEVPDDELHAGKHVTSKRHKKWADHIYDEFMKLTSK